MHKQKLLHHAVPSFALALGLASTAGAQTLIDFEGTDPLSNSLISGDKNFFQITSDQAADSTTYSIKPYDPEVKPADSQDNYPQDPFESFTYDVPIDLEAGTISVDFYDTFGLANSGAFEWAMSVILEDANNPEDFVAVEITRLPYDGGRYYASEGIDDASDSVFDTYPAGPVRSVGWHTINFNVTSTETTVNVDGSPDATEVEGPGGSADLRLRFMADSATGGGFSNWTQSGATSYPAAPGLVYLDNATFTATAPSSDSDSMGFESGEVDSPGVFMGPSAFDNPDMADFVNDFETTTTLTSEGSQSAIFANNPEPFKNLAFDLSSAQAGSITLSVYDALGQNEDLDSFGTILIEDGSNPADFIALELWNGPYPSAETNKNYYSIRSNPGGPADFNSDYFGDRSVGWHNVEIVLANTESYILIDGQENLDGEGRMTGPGLDSNPKLRLMNGSASNGGFGNYITETDELDIGYLSGRREHLYFDEISLPITSTGVKDWALY